MRRLLATLPAPQYHPRLILQSLSQLSLQVTLSQCLVCQRFPLSPPAAASVTPAARLLIESLYRSLSVDGPPDQATRIL